MEISLVPTLCVGTHVGTLCVPSPSRRDAERPDGVPTQSVGTRIKNLLRRRGDEQT